MKSVLFINRVYPPVQGATGDLLAELAEALVERGWRVSVIASRPPAQSQMSELKCRNSGQVLTPTLYWVSGLPFTRSSHWRRALSYLSLYPALWWRALRTPRHDVTVFLTDPPLQLVFAPILRRIKGTRIVHWAQDIYPEVAEQLGVIHPRGLLANLLRRLSNRALRRFDRVVVVGGCMRDRVSSRVQRPAQAASHLTVIPNWACPEVVLPISHERNPFRSEHTLDGHFVVMYSGNIGLVHTFESTLDAATLLHDRAPEVLFLFVGDGPRLAELREEAMRRGLTNLRFLPTQPRERLAESLSAADVHLVTMRDDLCGLVVPSKFYGITAAGRPVIFVGPSDSEVARNIVRERCGSVVSGSTGAGLAACLCGWRADAAACSAAGTRARAYAERTGLCHATDSFETLLGQLVSAPRWGQRNCEQDWRSQPKLRAGVSPAGSGSVSLPK